MVQIPWVYSSGTIKERIRRLIKANRSNFESKFFVFVSDVIHSYISYWKSVWFGRVHLNNGVKPRAVLNLERKKNRLKEL